MDQEEVYLQFEAFDFNNEDFQNGIQNVYESYLDQINEQNDGKISEIVTEIKSEEKSTLDIQAKTFYFNSKTGNIMNIEDYYEWRENRDQQKREQEQEQKQKQEKEKEQAQESKPNYQQIAQMILEGKEVPGIKQIPNTVLEGESSESTIQTRKKPWELPTDDNVE